MNMGRFLGAGIAVFVARFLMNFGFYGYFMRGRFEELASAHPGIFREVIPAYAAFDLVAALLIVYLFVKAGAAFGGGVKGGATLGVVLALLGPVLGSLYWYFSVTFYPSDLVAMETVFQIVAYAVQGAVAGAVYKAA
jgi:hypothetical protein